MECDKCKNQMILLSMKKYLDKNKNLWYNLLVWYCKDCHTRVEEKDYL